MELRGVQDAGTYDDFLPSPCMSNATTGGPGCAHDCARAAAANARSSESGFMLIGAAAQLAIARSPVDPASIPTAPPGFGVAYHAEARALTYRATRKWRPRSRVPRPRATANSPRRRSRRSPAPSPASPPRWRSSRCSGSSGSGRWTRPAVPYNQVLQRQLAADGFFASRGSTAAIARNVRTRRLVLFSLLRVARRQLATPGGEPPKGSFATLLGGVRDALRRDALGRTRRHAARPHLGHAARRAWWSSRQGRAGRDPRAVRRPARRPRRAAHLLGVFETLKQSGKDAGVAATRDKFILATSPASSPSSSTARHGAQAAAGARRLDLNWMNPVCLASSSARASSAPTRSSLNLIKNLWAPPSRSPSTTC